MPVLLRHCFQNTVWIYALDLSGSKRGWHQVRQVRQKRGTAEHVASASNASASIIIYRRGIESVRETEKTIKRERETLPLVRVGVVATEVQCHHYSCPMPLPAALGWTLGSDVDALAHSSSQLTRINARWYFICCAHRKHVYFINRWYYLSLKS